MDSEKSRALEEMGEVRALFSESSSLDNKILSTVDSLYERRVWQKAGYSSWPIACAEEWGRQVEVGMGLRRKVVAEMHDEGMTQQQIADALGVTKRTIYRDLVGVETPVPVSTRPKSPALLAAIPLVQAYLQENPTSSQPEAARATGVNRNTVRRVAVEIGHSWAAPDRPSPKSPTSQKPKPSPSQKPKRKPRSKPVGIDVPPQVTSLIHVHAALQDMRDGNGSGAYARYVTDAVAAGETKRLAARRAALVRDLDYLSGLIRTHDDAEYRASKASGVIDRDDGAGDISDPPALYAV